MKTKVFALPFLLIFLSAAASGQQKVRFMAGWTPQAQFTGFYVALEKGFYSSRGLDVEISHPGLNSSKESIEYLKDSEVDIITTHSAKALIARAAGDDLVDVLQLSQNSSLFCISREPIKNLSELKGKKVAFLYSKYVNVPEIYCHIHSIDIEFIYSFDPMALYVAKAVDAVIGYSFNELVRIKYSMGEVPESNVLFFSEQGLNFPEDGIYCTEKYLREHPDIVSEFIKASVEGWKYADSHRDESIGITMKYVEEAHIPTHRTVQKGMLEEVLRLQTASSGEKFEYPPLDSTLFNKMIAELYQMGIIKQIVGYNQFMK